MGVWAGRVGDERRKPHRVAVVDAVVHCTLLRLNWPTARLPTIQKKISVSLMGDVTGEVVWKSQTKARRYAFSQPQPSNNHSRDNAITVSLETSALGYAPRLCPSAMPLGYAPRLCPSAMPLGCGRSHFFSENNDSNRHMRRASNQSWIGSRQSALPSKQQTKTNELAPGGSFRLKTSNSPTSQGNARQQTQLQKTRPWVQSINTVANMRCNET